MNNVFNLIAHHKLQPGDAVELMCPVAQFPRHYAVYMGNTGAQPVFIANMESGVKLVKDQELNGFLVKYAITNVERFTGDEVERFIVVRKALSRLGEKAYSFVFNNCEHFKNWVLYGESKSHQVTKITAGVTLGGLALMGFGHLAKSKGLQKAGLVILLLILIAFVITGIIFINKTDKGE